MKRRDTRCTYVHWMVNGLRDKILRKKISRFCQPQTAKKKLEIDCKNLENSEIFTDEKSRDLPFWRNVNLEKIYLYNGPKDPC